MFYAHVGFCLYVDIKRDSSGEIHKHGLCHCSAVPPVRRVREAQGKDQLEEVAGNSSSLLVNEDLWCLPL